MQRIRSLVLLWAIAPAAVLSSAQAQSGRKYPPLTEYLMAREAEVALARSAAPAPISDKATIKVLTNSGYEIARQGDNGAVCMVMRGFAAPTYTPAQFRDLVMTHQCVRRSASRILRREMQCRITSYEQGLP